MQALIVSKVHCHPSLVRFPFGATKYYPPQFHRCDSIHSTKPMPTSQHPLNPFSYYIPNFHIPLHSNLPPPNLPPIHSHYFPRACRPKCLATLISPHPQSPYSSFISPYPSSLYFNTREPTFHSLSSPSRYPPNLHSPPYPFLTHSFLTHPM